jgi:hypothetical protein
MQRHQRQPLIFGAAADVEDFGNLVELLPRVLLPEVAMAMAMPDEVEWRILPGTEATVTDDSLSILVPVVAMMPRKQMTRRTVFWTRFTTTEQE